MKIEVEVSSKIGELDRTHRIALTLDAGQLEPINLGMTIDVLLDKLKHTAKS